MSNAKDLRGSHNEDNSIAINGMKKTQFQSKVQNSYINHRRKPIATIADSVSDLSSVPSVPDSAKSQSVASDSHYVSSEQRNVIDDALQEINPNIRKVIEDDLENLWKKGVRTIPDRGGLNGLYCFIGFTHLNTSIGKRLVYNGQKMAKIIYTMDKIKEINNKNQPAGPLNQNNNNQNDGTGGNNNNNNNNEQKTDASSNYSSSSFQLSHYSGQNNNYEPLQESHAGHRHGDDSTCYSGYSSAGYNASHLIKIKAQIREKAPLQIYQVKSDEWATFRFVEKTKQHFDANGTYYSDGSQMIEFTKESVHAERPLEHFANFIGLPDVDKKTVNNNNNNINNNNTMDLD